MSEHDPSNTQRVSREQLNTAADYLLRHMQAYPTDMRDLLVNKSPLTILSNGMVPPDVSDAISSENLRAIHIEKTRFQEAERDWENRSVGKKIADTLRFRDLFTVQGSFDPKPRFGYDFVLIGRSIGGTLPLDEEGWRLPVGVSQWSYDGHIDIAGERFTLDPSAKALQVDLSYPLTDGSRTDLAVSHALYPYDDEVRTKSQVIFGDTWQGIPNQPFTIDPAHPSVYMYRAMEMLAHQQS